MRKFLLFVISFVLIGSINAQFSINNPFERNYYFDIHKDYLKHTNMQPYFYPDSDEVNIDTKIDISPLYFSQDAFDLSDKNVSTFSGVGGILSGKFKEKIYFNLASYGILYKPESFFKNQADSMNLMPSYGNISKITNSFFCNLNFVGNLIYRPQNYIYFEMGKGKTFLGDGYRSLILSDNSIPYPYFRTVVEIWKVKYLYQISQLKSEDYRFATPLMSKKYVFTQYLSLNLWKRLNISMFETVVQANHDTLLAPRGIEISYLNPVIFLRSVEYNIGSPDNVLVGFSGHLKIFKSGMLYGQVFIDEFILNHITSKEEFWDEKYGIQAGMKFYRTFGIDNFYTQAEINGVRPYTYSHEFGVSSYTHNYQSLAHPLGSNFVEGLAIAGYRFNDFNIQAKLIYSKYGENDTINYGRNPLIPYTTHVEKDVVWLQGNKTSLKYAEMMFAYTKKVNISLTVAYRSVADAHKKQDNLILMFGISSHLFYNRYYDWN